MTKDCMSDDIVILILPEINWENWLIYFVKLFEEIDYVFNDTDTTCMPLHPYLDITVVYIVPCSWSTLYSLSDIDILNTDLWSCYTKLHTAFYLYWLIKLTKAVLMGEI